MGDDRRSGAGEQPEEFSDWLKEFRARLGMTQSKLARELDVPENTLQRWESGNFTPRFINLQALWRVATEHNLLPFIGKLDFTMVFFCRNAWREESREEPDRIYLKATLQNQIGIAAKVLTVIAEHRGEVIRVAGFQDGDNTGTSIFRVIFILPPDQRLWDVDERLNALEHVVSTEYPVRRLSPDMIPEDGSGEILPE